MNDLFGILERQVQFVQRQEGHRLFMALPGLIDFVQREPRLRNIADEVVREFDEAVNTYREADKRCAADALALFEKNEAWSGPIYARIAGEAVVDPMSHTRNGLRECASRSGRHDGDPLGFRKADSSQAERAITLLKSFADQLESHESLGENKPRHLEMTKRLAEISWDHRRDHFKFVHTMCASAGASWKILSDFAEGVCPEIPGQFGEDHWYQSYLAVDRFKKRVARADVLLGIRLSGNDEKEFEKWRETACRALEIFVQDMALRIGLSLSHRNLVMRFKTKCERFLADDLRAQMLSDSSRAESHATQAAAEFLFDHGLDPLFNAQVVRLRPDLFDPSLPHPLYIEAKQYGKDHPRPMIQKAIWQVWETWNELDSKRRVREAFLLVFRTGGPLVVFDESAHLDGRTLHPILVDIGPSDQRGSCAKEKPLSFTAADLLPQSGDST